MSDILLISLDATSGFISFSQVMEVVGQLQEKGINAVGLQSPGAPLDGAVSFQVRVPKEQLQEAQACLRELLSS